MAQEWCYKAQANHFLTFYNSDYEKAGAECMRAPESMRGACFMRLGQMQVADVPNPALAAEKYCATIPSAYLDECIIGGLRHMVLNFGIDPEGGPARFCRGLSGAQSKEICYTEYEKKMKDMFNDSAERLRICALFEDPFDAMCAARQYM